MSQQKKSQRKPRNVKKSSRKSVAKKSSDRKSVSKKSSTRTRKSVAKKSSTRLRKSVDKTTRFRKTNKIPDKKSVVKKRPVIIYEEKKKPVKVLSSKKDVIFGKDGISAISGPVSFYYLRPKKDVYKKGNGHYFPLIVLFGDYHSSLATTCKPCAWNKGQGCYKLSDLRFLRKLDTLSTPQHPVDFYTETVLSGTGSGFNGGMLKDLTSGEMISCYHHRLRGTSYDKCPTKNIRWHAGETRMIWTDELIYGYKEDYFMNNLYKNPSNISKMEKHTWIEQEFSTILFQLELLKKKNNSNVHKKIYRDRINVILRNGVFKNIEGFQRLLLTLCDDSNGSKYINLDKFAETFFGMFTKDNSLIYKQIAKQSYLPFRSFQKWVDFYKQSLNYRAYSYIRSLVKSKQEHRILYYIEKQNLRKTIENLPASLSDPDFDFSNFYLDEYFVTYICAPLLDLYTIARIMKQPTEGIRSSLSFGYFGDAHVENIVQLLVSTNMYEIVCEKPGDFYNISRCKTFDVTLNLSEEVRLHNGKIE